MDGESVARPPPSSTMYASVSRLAHSCTGELKPEKAAGADASKLPMLNKQISSRGIGWESRKIGSDVLRIRYRRNMTKKVLVQKLQS